MVLIVGGSICLVLMIAAGFLLWKFQGDYAKVQEELQSAQSRLEQLNRRSPFPSAENLEKTKENLASIQSYYSNVVTVLQKDQVEPESIEPSAFAPLLERGTHRVFERAKANGVKFPERFAMGFDRYAAGELPAPEHLPRLVTQVQHLESLLNLLIDARISELTALQRTMFDTGATQTTEAEADPRSRGRGTRAPAAAAVIDDKVPEVQSNALYAVERFRLTFSARESAVWEVLNMLARSRALFVVSSVRMENPLVIGAGAAQAAAKPAAAAAAPGQQGVPALPLTHEERIVAGREPVTVSLVVDAYRILQETPASGEVQP